MTGSLVAIALTALLFVWFAAFHRRGCDGASCGTGAHCGACPEPALPEEHDHA